MLNNKTILITGVAGFIGFHFSQKMLDEGWNVIGFDSINDYYDINLKYARLAQLGIDREVIEYNKQVSSSLYPSFVFYQGQLEDITSLSKVFYESNPNYVCNLAAQAGVRYSIENPLAYVNSNVVGFVNILELSRQYNVKHLVYASSSSVYGLNTKMPFSPHDDTSHPVSLYAATKRSNELMAHVYSKLYNLSTTGLRFFTVYGPWGRPDMSPMLFADAIMNNRPIKVFNQGNMSRDFTYIDDIVEGIMHVVQKPSSPNPLWISDQPDPASSCVPFKVYNIGNSSPVKLMDYIQNLENAMEKKAQLELLPMQPGDVVGTYSDMTDMESEFNYKPTTSLADGLSEFAKWYKEFYG